MGKIQRLTDKNAGGGAIDLIPQTTVQANNLLVSVNGSKGIGHGEGIHSYHAWQTANGSPNVFVGNIPVNFAGNIDTCNDPRVDGSSNVYVNENQGIDEDIPSIQAVVAGDELDLQSPGSGKTYIQNLVKSGVLHSSEITTPLAKTVDKSNPSNTATVISSDCSDIASIMPFPTGNAIDNIQLTTLHTVGSLTRKPSVVFDNPLRSTTAGISVEEICCNLKLLTINCIEPIIARYPNAVVTNTWRPAGIGSSTSQHPKGQAVDIQFRSANKQDYFSIAQWIRDNIVYDQLLLEYKTTGSGLPWIHISFNKSGNKKQVLTMLNDITYGQGLTQLA